MSQNPRDDRDLDLLLYASDELNDNARATLEERLAKDPALEDELREWRETVARLEIEASESVTPSAVTRQSFRQSLSARSASAATSATAPVTETMSRSAAPKSGFGLTGWLAAAAAVLAAFALARGWQIESSLEREIDGLVAERAQLETAVELLNSRLAGTEQDVNQLALALRAANSPDSRTIMLAGLEDAPQALGAAVVREGEAVFFAYNLQALPAENDYQLWFIGDQGPVSAGTFDVDPSGNARLAVSAADLENASTWAVTIEPAGGVEQPSGTMVLAGSPA